MIVLICIVVVVFLWLAYELENAPLLDEQTGDITYKEWIKFLGFKIKRRKNDKV
jgi:hypothetical protein